MNSNPVDVSSLSLQDVVAMFHLEPLPGEGGFFKRTYISEHSSCIYYAIGETHFSAMHRLSETEIYHWYAGAPLQLTIIHPDDTIEQSLLSNNIGQGHKPQKIVPANSWHGSRSTGAWTLVGTTMAPSYDDTTFELATPQLLKDYPQATSVIAPFMPST